MQLYDIHAKLYEGLPEGTIIHICEPGPEDARIVSDNLAEVAQALGLSGEELEAAQEGDHWRIDRMLSFRFQMLIAEYGVEEP